MARRRRSTQPRRPRPWDLTNAPEARAVRLPPADERYRGEHQDHFAEREPAALKEPEADPVGEGNVAELAQEMDIPEMAGLERNAQRSMPRVEHHPRPNLGTGPRRRRPSTGASPAAKRKGSRGRSR